ncbi:asparaginase [Eubacteriales bacterium OttesenSCG-928-N13]|nr:asparaginase [Eubacteriales bacterium OttesenSCG-928-N13]
MKKRILLLATGGTIASKPTAAGLAPMITPKELLMGVPGIDSLCAVQTAQPMNLDSTNMGPEHWLMLAECIRENYDAYDGFVVAHGTDTMAYTACALSYLAQMSPKPIVLTGAQKSIFVEDTDARMNLLDAFTYAVDDGSQGVVIVFDGQVITGTRARKTRTKSRNAFQSVDYPELAIVRDGCILRYIVPAVKSERPVFYGALDPKVALIKLVPGMNADVLDYLRQHNHALVIESFGVGGVPALGGRFMDAIEQWIREGKPVVMTTQVPHEGSDMEIYQVGRQVKTQLDVMEAYNMTLEAVITKLMWILMQTKQPEQVRKLFNTQVANDLLKLG